MTDLLLDPEHQMIAVRTSSKELVHLLEKGTPEALKQVFGIMGDSAKAWRIDNIMKIMSKYRRGLKKYKLTEKDVPLKFFYPFLATASAEEDETLQEKWTHLLMNAALEGPDTVLNAQFIETLGQLTRYDAVMLDKLYEFIQRSHKPDDDNPYPWLCPIGDSPWSDWKEVDEKSLLKIRLVQDKLIDLRVLQSINMKDLPFVVQEAHNANLATKESQLGLRRQTEVITFTPYGYAFVQACKRPMKAS